MTGKTNPSPHPIDDAGETARQLLAPLYGEAPALDLGEAAEFEAVRDLLADWVEEPAGAELSAPARAALLDRAFDHQDQASTVSPLGGSVWLRREGKGRVLAMSTRFQALPDDLLLLPTGSRAEVRLPDGSSILLKDHSRFVVGRVGGKNQGRLLAGRLYAWVEHQVQAAFRIATPLGTAAVLGTQFDLDLEEPRRVHLLVTKGKVQFFSGKGEGLTMSSHIVSRNRLLSATPLETSIRKLSPLEARRHTDWIRGEHPRRGRFSLFGAVVLLLAVGLAAFWFHNRSPKPPADAHVSLAQPPALLDKTAPLLLDSPCHEQGRVWRARASVHAIDPSGAPSKSPVRAITVRSETQSVDASGRARIIAAVEEFLAEGDKAREVLALRGLQFEIALSSDGAIESVQELGSDMPLTGPKLDGLGGAVSLCLVASLGPKATRTPGETWYLKSDFPLPGNPNSLIQIGTQFRFEGYARRNGAERAVVREQTTTLITGPYFVERQAKPPLVIDAYLDRLRSSARAVYYVDPQSNRVVEGEMWNQSEVVEGHLEIHAPERPIVHRPIQENNQPPSFTRFTLEYVR